MKTNFQNTILTAAVAMLIIVFGIFIGGAPVYADAVQSPAAQNPMDSNEAALFELINVARQYPLGMAEFLGMDRNQVIKDLPELADVLKTGLPVLTIDSRLDQTAAEHTTDMLQNGYYSYVSMDGRRVNQRMRDAGYIPSDFGESLGMIAFNNFLNPQKAVLQIFGNIYRNELDPAFDGQRNILNPDVKEVGIGFSGGVFQFERYSANAYVVTCDFGTEVGLQDLELLQLINQARAYPLAVADFYHKSLDGFFDLFPEYYTSISNGLPPLELNLQLYHAAVGHAADMAENEYVSHVSLDGRTPAMRLQENEYVPAWMAESIYRIPIYNKEESSSDVSSLFKLFFNGAFKTEGWNDRNIFSEEAADIGLSAVYQLSAIGNISTNDFQLAVIEYAAKEAKASPGIIGTVYKDLNGNGLYDAEEGVAGAAVTILKSGTEFAVSTDIINNSPNPNQVKTNAAGGFSIDAEPGSYIVQVQLDEGVKHAFTVDVGNELTWMGLDIETTN